jgi:hypothetical protein
LPDAIFVPTDIRDDEAVLGNNLPDFGKDALGRSGN